jgi:hypothetical protein
MCLDADEAAIIDRANATPAEDGVRTLSKIEALEFSTPIAVL